MDLHVAIGAAVSMMKGISIVKAGGPENLRYDDVDMPNLTEGQVLIKVYATALNGADLLQRAGNYPSPPGNVAELSYRRWHTGIGKPFLGSIATAQYASSWLIHIFSC